MIARRLPLVGAVFAFCTVIPVAEAADQRLMLELELGGESPPTDVCVLFDKDPGTSHKKSPPSFAEWRARYDWKAHKGPTRRTGAPANLGWTPVPKPPPGAAPSCILVPKPPPVAAAAVMSPDDEQALARLGVGADESCVLDDSLRYTGCRPTIWGDTAVLDSKLVRCTQNESHGGGGARVLILRVSAIANAKGYGVRRVKLVGDAVELSIDWDPTTVRATAEVVGGHYRFTQARHNIGTSINVALEPICPWLDFELPGIPFREEWFPVLSFGIGDGDTHAVSTDSSCYERSSAATVSARVPTQDPGDVHHVELTLHDPTARTVVGSFEGYWRPGELTGPVRLTTKALQFSWEPGNSCVKEPGESCPSAVMAHYGVECQKIDGSAFSNVECTYECRDTGAAESFLDLRLPTTVVLRREGASESWEFQLARPGQVLRGRPTGVRGRTRIALDSWIRPRRFALGERALVRRRERAETRVRANGGGATTDLITWCNDAIKQPLSNENRRDLCTKYLHLAAPRLADVRRVYGEEVEAILIEPGTVREQRIELDVVERDDGPTFVDEPSRRCGGGVPYRLEGSDPHVAGTAELVDGVLRFPERERTHKRLRFGAGVKLGGGTRSRGGGAGDDANLPGGLALFSTELGLGYVWRRIFVDAAAVYGIVSVGHASSVLGRRDQEPTAVWSHLVGASARFMWGFSTAQQPPFRVRLGPSALLGAVIPWRPDDRDALSKRFTWALGPEIRLRLHEDYDVDFSIAVPLGQVPNALFRNDGSGSPHLDDRPAFFWALQLGIHIYPSRPVIRNAIGLRPNGG